MTTLHNLLEEAADWIAAERDELILCETVGGDTATLPDEARQFVDDANDLIGRLQAAAQDSLAQPAAQAAPSDVAHEVLNTALERASELVGRGAPAAQAVPLTPRQLDSLIEKFVGGAELTDDEYDSMRQFAAEVERAHGITAQAVPLTDEQIRLIADSSGGLITGHTPGAIHLARAIERAHGIAAREVKPQ